MSLVPFHEVALAAYCPRKLYYARRHDDGPPEGVESVRALAFEYPALLAADAAALRDRPTAAPPERLRANLRRARGRFPGAWPELVDPDRRRALVAGRDCRGVVHKVLALDPPAPSLVSPGAPPEEGVWEPQSVRAVAAAKALANEAERPIERAFVEYPAHGVVREVSLTVHHRAAYKRALRTVRSMEGPPRRTDNEAKCEACEYRGECGVRTRSLRSLLGG